ncbi:hypothetical protein KUF71_021862 [Frankliniella fusca]|uniref:Uncharacterized protein n=1 Tax=Frankliniella fusca TaxID=407009 RepID=A0AAE1LBR2_9NEOP|nr:hypothetical protein KUF71_021862 [Frankliniella fusca]
MRLQQVTPGQSSQPQSMQSYGTFDGVAEKEDSAAGYIRCLVSRGAAAVASDSGSSPSSSWSTSGSSVFSGCSEKRPLIGRDNPCSVSSSSSSSSSSAAAGVVPGVVKQVVAEVGRRGLALGPGPLARARARARTGTSRAME